MEHAASQDPALTIALAAAAGMLAQTVARHIRVPGIVLLLGTGLLLGPDGLGVVRPGTLGASLHSLVGRLYAAVVEGRRQEIAAGLQEAGWSEARG